MFDSFDESPMFIELEDFTFTTTAQQGINTQKIQDVEVFADGFSIGVFNLPAKVPVLSDNATVDIVIFPNIRNNGQISASVSYPFYKEVRVSLPFEPEQVVPVQLNFSYRDDAQIVNVCDFEGANCFVDNFDMNLDILFNRSSETIYGNFCGKITLPEDNTFFEKSTFNSINKSDLTSTRVYLEMDYRCETEFSAGVLLSGGGLPDFPAYAFTFKPTSEWNKIYIELSELIVSSNIESFKVIYGTTTPTTTAGSIWVDNVRVLYF